MIFRRHDQRAKWSAGFAARERSRQLPLSDACTWFTPVRRTTSRTFSTVIPPPGSTCSRPLTCERYAARLAAPSSALAFWPELSARVTPSPDQHIQGSVRIGRNVKGAMKDCLPGTCERHECTHTTYVYSPIGLQAPKHDAVGAVS